MWLYLCAWRTTSYCSLVMAPFKLYFPVRNCFQNNYMCGVQDKESLNEMLPEASQEADHSSSPPKLKQQNEEACLCKHFPQDNRATDMIWYIF